MLPRGISADYPDEEHWYELCPVVCPDLRRIHFGLPLGAQPPATTQQVEMIGGHKAVAREVLVRFRDDVSPRLQAALATRYGIQSMRGLNRSGVVHMRSASLSTARLIEQLSADPDVLYAEPNYIVRLEDAASTALPNDPDFPIEWGLQNDGENGGVTDDDIDALAAWSITTGPATWRLALWIRGIDYTHPDLKANIWSAPSAYTISFAPGQIIRCPAGSHGFDAILDTCDPMDQENRRHPRVRHYRRGGQ